MKSRVMTLVAVLSILGACGPGAGPDNMCEAVADLAEIRAEVSRTLYGASEPDPVEVAHAYREQATRYHHIAGYLAAPEAVKSTRDLASMFERGAALFEDADQDDLENIVSESAVLRSLERRMTGQNPLGFSSRAWQEIDARCDVPVDTTADQEDE
ncbi:MAG: hypothetical protein ACLFRT_03640 [Actinomycetota bacterium]